MKGVRHLKILLMLQRSDLGHSFFEIRKNICTLFILCFVAKFRPKSVSPNNSNAIFYFLLDWGFITKQTGILKFGLKFLIMQIVTRYLTFFKCYRLKGLLYKCLKVYAREKQ